VNQMNQVNKTSSTLSEVNSVKSSAQSGDSKVNSTGKQTVSTVGKQQPSTKTVVDPPVVNASSNTSKGDLLRAKALHLAQLLNRFNSLPLHAQVKIHL